MACLHVYVSQGGMMEEWHQKLHNNSSPDDLAICQALLDYLASGQDINVYWDSLAKERKSAHALWGWVQAAGHQHVCGISCRLPSLGRGVDSSPEGSTVAGRKGRLALFASRSFLCATGWCFAALLIAGIDAERLASYDRPIRSPPPTFKPEQVQGLTEDLIAYRCARARCRGVSTGALTGAGWCACPMPLFLGAAYCGVVSGCSVLLSL
jgi:hypothetical protein